MNRKRLQELRNVIAGIPEKQIDLSKPYADEKNLCSTIACIGGWGSVYPPFKEAGIGGEWMKFFGLRGLPHRGWELFDFRRPGERGTDKQIALRRLDKLLKTGTSPTSGAAEK